VRVVHLIDHMGVGGAQRVVIDLVEARGAGLEAAVLSLRDHWLPGRRECLASTGASCESVGLSARRPWALGRLRSRLAELAPDLLHTHLEVSDSLGALAALSLGRRRPLLVSHVHNDPAEKYRPAQRLAGRLLAGWIDAHVVSGNGLAGTVRRAFAGHPGRLEVIPYGIHPRWLEGRCLQEARGRAAALRRGAKRVVGVVGRLAPQKAIHGLLRAAPRLLAAEPSTRILLVGDGPLRSQLEAEVRDLGVAGAVDFLGYQSDLAPVYAALDVFVLPSQYEGLPLALLEAMATGVPCVVSDLPGIRDAVEDGATGLRVPPGDAEALAAALLRVLSDAALAAGLRERARERVRREHSRERMLARTEALYRELLACRSGVRA
jgi:glycosyltransferase involved in cell wall biosynthesis